MNLLAFKELILKKFRSMSYSTYPYQLEFLPMWSIGESDGSFRKPYTALMTKDGRKIGNAVVVDDSVMKIGCDFIKIVTDAGTILLLTDNEIQDFFHTPQWIMRDILPAHKNALLQEAVKA